MVWCGVGDTAHRVGLVRFSAVGEGGRDDVARLFFGFGARYGGWVGVSAWCVDGVGGGGQGDDGACVVVRVMVLQPWDNVIEGSCGGDRRGFLDAGDVCAWALWFRYAVAARGGGGGCEVDGWLVWKAHSWCL